MIRGILAIAILAAASCAATPIAQDAGAGGGNCATACAHLRALGCSAGEPTPSGAPCEAVCANVQVSGVLRWDLGCRSHAATCEAIDACEAKP